MEVFDFHEEDDDFEFEGFTPNDLPLRVYGRGNRQDSDSDNSVPNNSDDIEVSSVSSSNLSESDNDDASVRYNYKPNWTRTFTDFTVPYFAQAVGPELPADFDVTTATPLDYFKLFIPDQVFEMMVENTNKYVDWSVNRKRAVDPNYVEKHWTDTSVEEMKAYFGLNILFGLNHVPSYRQYWSTDPFLGNEGIKRVMPLRRFEKLTEYFHLTDRSREAAKGTPNYDRLAKIRPLIDIVSEACPKYNKPSACQSIDEGMIGFRGRVNYLQYMPLKPIKRGIKIFIRCDSETGYMNQFDVYLGKAGEDDASENGFCFDIVDKLTKPIRYKYHRVFFDNYYTSIPILVHLHKHGIYSCGTLRGNKRLQPPEVKQAKKSWKRGRYITFQDSKLPVLTCTAWKDVKLVRMASTMSKPYVLTTALRRVKADLIRVQSPHCVAQYQKYMRGVDLFDQYRAKYKVGRFGKKCWRYIFWFLVSSSIVNAWIIYRSESRRLLRKKRYAHVDFRHELATALIHNYSSRQREVQRALLYGVPNQAAGQHHINIRMLAKRPKRCIGHSRFQPNGIRKHETVYGCASCNIYLCKQCHLPWHNAD